MHGLVKIPKDQIDEKFLKKALRATGESYANTKVVDCWEEDDDNWLIPRQWALTQGHSVSLPNNRKADWGSFRGDYREGQLESILACTQGLQQHYGGRLEAYMGSGKTLMTCDIASRLKTKTLILVHKEDLIDQWRETAKEHFGVEAGIIQQDKWQHSSPITVGIMQTLYSRLNQLPAKFWKEFGMVVTDEGHRVPARTFLKVVNNFNSRYKFGVSATWRRSDNLEIIWSVTIRGGKRPRNISVLKPESSSKTNGNTPPRSLWESCKRCTAA